MNDWLLICGWTILAAWILVFSAALAVAVKLERKGGKKA